MRALELHQEFLRDGFDMIEVTLNSISSDGTPVLKWVVVISEGLVCEGSLAKSEGCLEACVRDAKIAYKAFLPLYG
jgi:hypothetical protein